MLIFIAVPTTGVVTNGKLNESFIRDVARLHELHPEHTFIIPMIQDYALLPYLQVEATWEVWGKHCKAHIRVCDQVWVLKYNGYKTSVGVKGEIELADMFDRTVLYMDPTWICQPVDRNDSMDT